MRWHIAPLWLASGSAGDRADSIYNGLCNRGGESMSGDVSPFNMLLGFGLLGLTVIVQAIFQFILLRVLERMPAPSRTRQASYYSVVYIVVAVSILTIGLMTEVNIWAALYYTWGNVGSYANAIYFSMASFTTIGASDVVSLSPAHRVVGAQEAGVGMLMFGWTTALLMEVIQRTRAQAT
jgi:hypothetical protein